MKRHGRILERTKYDQNPIRCNDTVCEMDLFNEYGKFRGTTIFPVRYLPEIKKHKWGMHNAGYAQDNSNAIFLHHLIIPKKKGFDIDHIDGNKLNNLDHNLRRCTHQQNNWNKKVKGYYWEKDRNKWVATLYMNSQKKLFKRFDTKEEAVESRRKAEQKYFGEYAYREAMGS
jgi:hypothetical protein